MAAAKQKAPPTFESFASQFIRLTDAQRVLIRISIDGLDPQGEDPSLVAELFGDLQGRPPEEALTVLLWLLGRGSGKSMLGGLYALWRAFTCDVSKLAPGEQALVPLFAVDTRQARQTLRYSLGYAKSHPKAKASIEGETKDGFSIKRGDKSVRIEVLPVSPGGGSARGRSIAASILDETSWWDDADSEGNAPDMISAISPRLMPGAKILSITTAWIESGWVYETFQSNYGRPSSALVARGPTAIMRAGDPDVELMIRREVARDQDNAEREFSCRFLNSGGVGRVFDVQQLRADCVDDTLPISRQLEGVSFAGTDLGFAADSSALVICSIVNGVIHVTDIVERRPRKNRPLKPSEVISEFQARMKAQRVRIVACDIHHEPLVREHLKRIRVVRGPDGVRGKQKMHEVAQQAAIEGRLVMPRHPQLLKQLGEIRAKPRPGGGVSISSPRRGGRHGDLASALVSAIWCAETYNREGEYQPTQGKRRSAVEALGVEAGQYRLRRSSEAARAFGRETLREDQDELGPPVLKMKPGAIYIDEYGAIRRHPPTVEGREDWYSF